MTYQSFKKGEGSSDSYGKLEAIQLPDLTGLKVLDLACNEGFFSYKAAELGASKVVGIDFVQSHIDKAKARSVDFSNLDEMPKFYQCSWDKITKYRYGKFDVVLLLSSLHYAENQQKLILKIADLIVPGGLFIFEGGIHNGPESWAEYHRGVGDVYYPNFSTIVEMLEPSFEIQAYDRSVPQKGDTVERWVIHSIRSNNA